jgi:hypothetical protein
MLMFRTRKPVGQETSGAVAIEFGFAAPILAILLVGVAEVGYSAYQAMQVQYSVEAGALYAAKNGWNSGAITAAVLNATGIAGMAASPPPAQFCGCPTASGVSQLPCTSTCSDGNRPGQYVQINASLARQSLIPGSGLPVPTTFTAQSIIRLN